MCVVRLLAEISTVGAGFGKTRTTVPHSIWHFRSEKGYAIFHCYEYHLDSLLWTELWTEFWTEFWTDPLDVT